MLESAVQTVPLYQAAYSNVSFVIHSYILPNTMYDEGTYAPCGETPPATASAIQDWMLLSTPDLISVFPGTDDGNVVDAAFHLVCNGRHGSCHGLMCS